MIPDEFTGGPRFGAFCAHYLRHTKGRWAGQPLIFEAWQNEFWREALEVDPITGLRVYQEIGLGLPRKNSKSTMASGAGLYFLTAEGEAEPEVYVAAGARQQAGIVLGQARSMALRSPLLLDHVRVLRYLIECPRNGGVMRALSADAGLQHGLNPSCNIVDELHAHKNGELYTALTTGTGAREQPFTLWITTAGVAYEGILWDLYSSMTTGGGELEERTPYLRIYRDRANGVLIYWYGAPRHADVADPEVWLGCNPASWLQDLKYLRQQYNRLKDRNNLLEWRRYHLNQFVEHEDTWLPAEAWQVGTSDLPLNPDLPVGIGVYKAADSSLAAVVISQRQAELLVTRARFFVAESATGRVSTLAMRDYLRSTAYRYPKAQMRDSKGRALRGPAVAYEKWQFTESAEELDQDGLNMVDFGQLASTMGPASTAAYELITAKRVKHEADPVLDEHIRNSTAVLTDRGMRVVPNRKKANHGAIAFIMSAAMAMQDAPAPSPRRRAVGF